MKQAAWRNATEVVEKKTATGSAIVQKVMEIIQRNAKQSATNLVYVTLEYPTNTKK